MDSIDATLTAMWARVVLWSFLAATTFYNAHRYRGLMLAWFVMLGVLFMFLSIGSFLRATNSPFYLLVNNVAFTPIAFTLVTLSVMFIINHKVRPPFNRRKEDV